MEQRGLSRMNETKRSSQMPYHLKTANKDPHPQAVQPGALTWTAGSALRQGPSVPPAVRNGRRDADSGFWGATRAHRRSGIH